MTAAAPSRRGQPLTALGGVLVGWVALRSLFFAPPGGWPLPEPVLRTAPRTLAILDTAAGAVRKPEPPQTRPVVGGTDYAAPVRQRLLRVVATPRLANPSTGSVPLPVYVEPPPRVPSRAFAVSSPARPDGSATPEVVRPPSSRRWSGDAWLFWRGGGGALGAAGGAAPSYGGSQAGALLRYELAPGNRMRPAAYFRAVRALDVRSESDLAAGIAMRPIPALRITAHGELRARRRGAAVHIGPAAFLSTGADDVPLPAGMTLRGYAQAGYVGGRDATAFADGSAVAERNVLGDDTATLAVGAGAWGGAQQGAARLDLGPSVAARVRIGNAALRLSGDYRLRVAGNAVPSDGATVTLSAGF